MARTRIKWHPGAPFRDVLAQWAKNDGVPRGERVAAAMRAQGVEDVRVWVDDHPSRPSIHVISDDPKAAYKEANTGRMVRALDAAG